MNQSFLARYTVLLGMSALLGGCATHSPPPTESATEPTPAGTRIIVPPPETQVVEEPTGTLSLPDALALALQGNPELARFSWDMRIGEARILQAGLRPNPEAGLEIENVLGTGEFRGGREAETTLELGQLIELGGKRAARIEAASAARELAAWDYETARIGILTQTAANFVEMLSLQQRLVLADNGVEIAEQVVNTVQKRVEAARTLAVEATKAEVALASVQIERDQIQRSLVSARHRLATTWGSTNPQFDRVEGDLETLNTIPSLNSLYARLEKNPDIARWATQVLQREANLKLEKARRMPDITLGGGYRRLNGPDDNAFLAGVSIPLPLFNKNQGNIKEAEYRLAQADAERHATKVRIQTQLSQAWHHLSSARAEVVAINEAIIPRAEESFTTLQQYYAEGRLGFLEVLDAQRTLFSARTQYFRALNSYHRAVLEVEQLIGEPLFADSPRN